MPEMRAVTLEGSDKTMSSDVVRDFEAGLEGKVIHPGETSFDEARKIFNGMVDRRPAAIVQCATDADVVRTVGFASSYNLLTSIRGGGHSTPGKCISDGGLMIDFSKMKGINVDQANRVGIAQPGLRLGEFDPATQAFGLATTMGMIANTGIAGLTLGGGLGWLNGRFGLACDNLLAAQVVTADGKLVRASLTENEDLLWALKGGSGNFGVVTSFEYQLHEVGTMLGGMVVHPLSSARSVLRMFDEFSQGCPDELSTAAACVTGPDGGRVIAIIVGYSGPIDAGEKVIAPLRKFGPPLADTIQPMSYVALQSMLDPGFPPGRLHYWKSNYTSSLSDGFIDVYEQYLASIPSPMSGVLLQQKHGAAIRVDPSATAYAHRSYQYDFVIASTWENPSESAKNIEWTRDFWDAQQPYVDRAVYVNHLEDEGQDRVKAAYGKNYDRLAEIKLKYDPANFFRLNQNIRPA